MSTTKEKIKTLLICVLLLGMLYLAYSVWFFDSPFEMAELGDLFGIDVDIEMSETGAGADLEVYGIRPTALFMKNESNDRGAAYESAASDEEYRRLRDLAAKIFASGKEIKISDKAAWTLAISGNGLFLDYGGNVPVEAINLWLGNSFNESGICGRYFMLSTAQKNVIIYSKNSETGEVFVQETSFGAASLDELISKTQLKEASLAVAREEENFRAVSDETIIATARAKLPVISAYNLYSAFSANVTEACLDVFRLRDVSPGTYSEADGTAVYIADMVTLKISPSGAVSYTDPREHTDETLGIEVSFDGEKPTFAEKTESARALVAALASKLPSSGGIYMINSAISGDMAEFTFERHIGGVPVQQQAGAYFARVSINGDVISAVRVNLRGYEVTAQSADVLPEQLVAAAISGSNMQGQMSLRYNDTGAETASPEWFTGVDKEGADELVES